MEGRSEQEVEVEVEEDSILITPKRKYKTANISKAKSRTPSGQAVSYSVKDIRNFLRMVERQAVKSSMCNHPVNVRVTVLVSLALMEVKWCMNGK